jgi:hypothetical protein
MPPSVVDDETVIRPTPRSPSVEGVLTGFWTVPVLPGDVLGVRSDVSDSAIVVETASASPFPSWTKATDPVGD